jgi:hypothetical protein
MSNALDFRNLGPADLMRLVNSTPLGPVLGERRLINHRNRAGFRIGSGRTVDLVRYAAWLVAERHAPRPEKDHRDPIERERERKRRESAEIFASGRDIGDLPAVVDPVRKSLCEESFREFCDSYFPRTFALEWSDDHLRVIGQIEDSVLRGGLFATAMPRGSGKTTLAEIACIWAVLYGHRDFVALIGSDEGHAAQMLDSIKTELDGNEALLEDFPEAVYPIAKLEGISNRCNGQTFKGERTHIGWSAKEVVLPTIPDSLASGAIIKVCGITGGLRGMKFKRPDGRTARPSLVILDDPQTDESARSPSQCATRERILAGAVLGLAGPGKKIAGIMPCTVISPGDMADAILDRDKHPDWNGTRTRMVYSFPSNEKLWEEYGRIRADGLRAEDGGKAATEFYAAHRDEMDAGAKVAWPARFNHDELSAIQHAMNLRFRDERAFWSEYQNQPLPEEESRDDLDPDQIASKVNRHRKGLVPLGWGLSRPATALFHASGCQDDAPEVRQGGGPRRADLRRPRRADQRPTRPRVASGRRDVAQDRTVPDRCELGRLDLRCEAVLPAIGPRGGIDPCPRQVCRGRVLADGRMAQAGGRAGRAQLAVEG